MLVTGPAGRDDVRVDATPSTTSGSATAPRPRTIRRSQLPCSKPSSPTSTTCRRTGSDPVAGGRAVTTPGSASPRRTSSTKARKARSSPPANSPSCTSRWPRRRTSAGTRLVNDASSLWSDGADRDRSRASSTAATAPASGSAPPSPPATTPTPYRVLYEDIDNDQRFWNALSALVLLAAALAAFNLINRIVEAQRREIGIGMALGSPRPQLAIRPDAHRRPGRGCSARSPASPSGMLVGEAFADLLEIMSCRSRNTAPRSRRHLPPSRRARHRRSRSPPAPSPSGGRCACEPIEAIRTGHLAARVEPPRRTGPAGSGFPGSSMSQMPLRNVLQDAAPHRC